MSDKFTEAQSIMSQEFVGMSESEINTYFDNINKEVVEFRKNFDKEIIGATKTGDTLTVADIFDLDFATLENKLGGLSDDLKLTIQVFRDNFNKLKESTSEEAKKGIIETAKKLEDFPKSLEFLSSEIDKYESSIEEKELNRLTSVEKINKQYSDAEKSLKAQLDYLNSRLSNEKMTIEQEQFSLCI